MATPEAMIHNQTQNLVSIANALEQAAANQRWMDVSQLLVEQHQSALKILEALEQIEGPKVLGSTDIPRTVPVTGAELLRKGMNLAPKPKPEPAKPVGEVANKPTI